MRPLLVTTFVVVAACSGTSPAPATVGNTASPSAPAGPAPTIAWSTETAGSDFGSFAWDRLPAVTADGANVVIPRVREDGARGEPNLTIEVKDRADTRVHEQVVLALAGGDGAAAPTAAAIDAGNAYLATTHAERDLVPLAVAAGHVPDSEDRTGQLSVGGLEVTWNEGHVVVALGGQVVVERDAPGWLARPYPMCASCPPPDGDLMCTNPSFLREAFADAARRVVVLHIAYEGTDTCWEPDSEYHVVTW